MKSLEIEIPTNVKELKTMKISQIAGTQLQEHETKRVFFKRIVKESFESNNDE